MPDFPRLFLLVTACMVLATCTRDPDLIGVDNNEIPVAAVEGAGKVELFIATTREASDVTAAFYSGERAPELAFASVTVSIPPTHVPGQLERPKRLPPDPRTEFAVIDPKVFETDDVFIGRINRELAKLPPEHREVLLFVHGYNNTFSDAVLRLAQFIEDTGFEGVPVLFSWASAAKTPAYVYDLNSALVARPKLVELSELLGTTNARGFDVFAHSMGSLLVLETLVQQRHAGQLKRLDRVNNIMLAAPDIDIDLFRTQLAALPKERRNFFVFVSQDDRALGISQRISGGVDRVGSANAAELAALGVTVIDLSDIEDSAAGTHAKFAGSPDVVQLIGNSLRQDNFRRARQSPTFVEVLEGVPVLRVIAQ